MKLGAKFADLVYANNSGINGVVLILNDSKEESSCDHISDFQMLKKCFLKSNYKFDISPYVLEKGFITKKNVNKILVNLSHSGLEQYKAENLIGHGYVTFKESMVEFKSDELMIRKGASPASFLGAKKDRVGRGYLMLAVYLYNIDQKDDNSRTVIAKNFGKDKKDQYFEFTHDFGASMGKPGQSLHINGMRHGKKFMKQGSIFTDDIIIKQMMIWKPKAWKKTTFADAMWMARKILRLSKADLEEVAASTLWPKYMQDAFVQKMRLRRNRIAKVFHMTDELDPNERTLPRLIIKRELKTKSDRESVAKEFNLDVKVIEKILRRNGHLDKDGKTKYTDYLVKNNTVISCHRSLITNLLEKTHFPSGLERRQERAKDDKPLPNCTFKN